MITYGSVCSGIEAATTAWHPLGWSPRWFAEIEPFPSAVLAHHWPDVPNLGDFTAIRDKIAEGAVEAPDVLVGGTPCQAFSVAGLRQSMGDSRGQLTLEFVRLANAIDSARSFRGQRPVTVVWENVPGVLTTPDNAFGCFLAGLVGEDDPLEPPGGRWTNAGYVRGPRRAVAWRILDAQYFGVAQRRRRVFVVASAGAVCPEKVLFEFDGVRRDSPPSRQQGQGASADAPEGTGAGSHWDGVPPHPSLTQSSQASGGIGQSNQELFSQGGSGLVQGFQGDIARTLQARHDSSPCADRGMDVVAIAFSSKDYGADASEGLDASDGETGRGAGAIAVGFNARQDPDSWVGRTGPLDTDGGTQAVAVQGLRLEEQLRRQSRQALPVVQVRRLTPTEAERLQGFPDGRTKIPWRGKPAEDCPDGPRYKALGNSMAVPVMRWIGARLDAALRNCQP